MRKKINIELLKKVRKVDAPPYLYTRIRAKINALREETVPTAWKWTGAFAMAAMLLFNVWTMQKAQLLNGSTTAMDALAEGLQMNNANQLYHE